MKKSIFCCLSIKKNIRFKYKNTKMANDEPIIFTRNYYHDIDPQNYYKDGIKRKAIKSLPIRPVYVSDLIDQEDCEIRFGRYRNKDDASANFIIKSRSGKVQGYNPETKLLKISSKKKNPRFNKFDKKIRYVEPEISMVDLSVHGREGKSCILNHTKCNDKPDCIIQLDKLVKEYNENRKKFFNQSLVSTVKGAGRRSRRTAKK
jgi:hypothetical protein